MREQEGWPFSLLNSWAKPSLAQWRSALLCFVPQPCLAMAGHERGLEERFAGWLLVTINSTFSPPRSDSAPSQAWGNKEIFLLSHTPSSPWQQMGKWCKLLLSASRLRSSQDHTHGAQVVQTWGMSMLKPCVEPVPGAVS